MHKLPSMSKLPRAICTYTFAWLNCYQNVAVCQNFHSKSGCKISDLKTIIKNYTLFPLLIVLLYRELFRPMNSCNSSAGADLLRNGASFACKLPHSSPVLFFYTVCTAECADLPELLRIVTFMAAFQYAFYLYHAFQYEVHHFLPNIL